MKKLFTFVLGSTALAGVTMTTPAQAADFEPDPTYSYAATAFVGGGGSWLQRSFGGDVRPPPCRPGKGCDDLEIAHIVGGGDFVIPLDGTWNIQLGGALHTSHQHFEGNDRFTRTQFQGSAIGFWRDPTIGVFGFEVGLFSPFEGSQESVKLGGVAQYFFGDMMTFGAFGGALVAIEEPCCGKSFDTGIYAGGDATYYASETLAVAGFARFTELGETSNGGRSDRTVQTLNVGGKVRYLTSLPGVEVFASGSYLKCESDQNSRGRTFIRTRDGAQVMGGVQIRLGGLTDSLVAIDRSNAIDTRAWECG